MELVLKRYNFGEKSTLGKLFIGGVFFCYVLEDKVREIENEPVAKWKIPSQTAIPRGKYKVIIDFSSHFGTELPHLLDVPGFDGVRIHWGNTDIDTEGCLLVGSSVVNEDFISNSRATFNHLFDLMEASYERGEDISIEVS